MTQVIRRVDLDVDAEELWSLISDPAQLATWLGDEVDLDVRPGGHGVIVDDGVTYDVEVDEVVEGERVSWRWSDGEGTASRVELVVEPDGDAAGLVVTETLLEPEPVAASPTIATAAVRWEVRAALTQLRAGCVVA